MTRKTWVYVNRDGGGCDVYERGQEPEPGYVAAHNPLAGDRHYADTVGPKGEDLTTRTKHREYMKANGLTTADDYTKTWADAEAKRVEYFKHGKGGAITKDDLRRTWHELTNR